jgi:hypothetical protein
MFVDNEFIGYSNWKSMVASGKIGLRGSQNFKIIVYDFNISTTKQNKK